MNSFVLFAAVFVLSVSSSTFVSNVAFTLWQKSLLARAV